jgi:hypothetical protein
MAANEWYCRIDGEVIGPLSARAIKTMAAVGELIPTDEVQNGPKGAWQPASKVSGLQFASATRIAKPSPQPPAVPQVQYKYKMVQVPPHIFVGEVEEGIEAAAYLQRLVNKRARDGWEFFRVDTLGVKTIPGCLGMLLGQRGQVIHYYVVTFRKVRD